jgi:hypothetical protein
MKREQASKESSSTWMHLGWFVSFEGKGDAIAMKSLMCSAATD